MRLRAAATYLGAAVLLTWPLAAQPASRLGAVEGAGDPFLNLWILGWGMAAWLTDPMSVFDGRVFNANIFHPAAGTLTFSDHLLLQSLVLSPLYALTGSLVLCYNALLIASLALSGVAMHLLARAVTGSERAAFIAGLAWACWPYRTAHFLHLQLQSLYFLPLALLALHRFAATRSSWVCWRRCKPSRRCTTASSAPSRWWSPPCHWPGPRGSGGRGASGRGWRWPAWPARC
jgi:hypothetical protein